MEELMKRRRYVVEMINTNMMIMSLGGDYVLNSSGEGVSYTAIDIIHLTRELSYLNAKIIYLKGKDHGYGIKRTIRIHQNPEEDRFSRLQSKGKYIRGAGYRSNNE